MRPNWVLGCVPLIAISPGKVIVPITAWEARALKPCAPHWSNTPHGGSITAIDIEETNAVRPWLILAALALARIGFGYQFQTVATMAPDLVPLFHLSYAALGTLIGAFMLSGMFVALPLGLLGRRYGDRPVLASGLALMIVGAVINAAADGPPGIALGRTIAGAGAVAMIVLQGKVIADWFTGRRFMIGISVSVSAYPVGVGIAQLVLPPVSHMFGWKVAFLTDAAVPAAALILFLLSYRLPPHVAGQSRAFSFPSKRECLLLVISGLIWTAYTSGYIGYTSYLPSTLTARGDSLGLIGLVMVIATWGNVPATLWGGDLAARFGALTIFLIGTAALVIGMVGTTLPGGAVGWAFLVGVLGSIHPGVIMAVGTLSARPENRAVGMGLFYSLYYLGGTAGPALCGYTADLVGRPEGGLLAAAAISAITVPLYLLHRKLARHETMLARA
jgi:predicted MFS family arabinose efflux permease